jgi:hypothetical protein
MQGIRKMSLVSTKFVQRLNIGSRSNKDLESPSPRLTIPSTLCSPVLAWMQAPRAAIRYAITALTPKSSVPARSVSPEIIAILSKQCPLMSESEQTCEADDMDATTPLTMLQSLRTASRWAISLSTIGTIAWIASSFTMLPSKLLLLSIWLALGDSVFFGAPAARTAMCIYGNASFASFFYFYAVIVKCLIKSPVQNKERSNVESVTPPSLSSATTSLGMFAKCSLAFISS